MIPLVEPKEKLSLDNYVIAGIDILGTKEYIQNEKNDEYLNLINKIYKTVINYCESNNNNSFSQNSLVFPKIGYKIFSDNIAIYTKIVDEIYPPTIDAIIGITALFQATALTQGLLTRGAIAMGELYSNETFIYGKSLVEVVETEKNIAIYPRVILCESIAKHVSQCNSLISTDFDNKKFVNYYSFINYTGNRIKDNDVDNIKNIIISEQNKYQTNAKIMQKLGWLKNYHNSYVSKLIGTWGITNEYLIQPIDAINDKIIVRNNSGQKELD